MRVFVAGASGAIGTRLVPQLIDAGHQVIGTFHSPGNAEGVRALGAEATVLALEHDAAGIYNVVDDEPAPVREWLPWLANALGAKPPRRVPRWLARLVAGDAAVMMGTESRGASNTKAKRELGWTLRHPSWRQGFPAAYGQPRPLQTRV